ncbi:MAG: hypothetical protein CBB65_07505 [Hyphomonadaceae bacterium TMED5]|nr:hypothetical protein [Ponticaulis sp.]OUX99913.1 MAG: hypothetical protein CBB65_07505 [Hyphomonadaceae bacterium TMED5]|tara:strand:- start:251134 stop:252426 length:1293 start_codon:yes stop_codon:yes gene_type:complete
MRKTGMRILKWIAGILATIIILAVVGCSTVGLPKVSATPETTRPQPDLLEPMGVMDQVRTAEDWTDERAPFWRNMLLSQVYGTIPEPVQAELLSDGVITTDLLDGRATLTAVRLKLTIGAHEFVQDVHFVIPNTPGPHPVILGAGSCPNTMTLPFEGVTVDEGVSYPDYCEMSNPVMSSLAHFIFGRYIETPPLEEIIDHGFAFGAYYPGMVVPDSTITGMEALGSIRQGTMEHGPYAAIGVWSWVASRIMDYVETSDTLDAERVILFGHSRTAKSSLLAGALDERIAGVISHQSGTGGAALQKNNVGESIEEITETFPHWFTPTYALYAGREADMPFDQHALVSLMAPRPLLLGNSARDRWADPRGTFSAARAAGEVYELLGAEPFSARNLNDFQPDATLAFQFRPGTHGITPEDWSPFLEWLDHHFSE